MNEHGLCEVCGHIADRIGYLLVCPWCGHDEMCDLEVYFELWGDQPPEDYDI